MYDIFLVVFIVLFTFSIFLFFKALFLRPLTILYIFAHVLITLLLLWWLPGILFGLGFAGNNDMPLYFILILSPASLWMSILLLGFHYLKQGDWQLKPWKKTFVAISIGLTICINIFFLLQNFQ